MFRSNLRVALRICKLIVAIGSPFLFAATVIGQYRADRFPSFIDLFLALVIPVVTALVIGALFALAVRAYPVTVLPEGLRGYNTLGLYRTVAWDAMTDVQFMTLAGLPYLYITAGQPWSPLTLPLWLDDMPAFTELVSARAGQEHILSTALYEVGPGEQPAQLRHC